MKIISIDPGYERLGVAVIECNENGGRTSPGKEKLLFSDCITTDKKLPHAKRLQKIGEGVRELISQFAPQELAIEKLFFNQNTNTALAVSEAVGVVLYEAAQHNISAFSYTPGEIKMAMTGYGRGTKDQVTEMVKRLIKITKPTGHKTLDDEYDAIAVGLTHSACRGNILSGARNTPKDL